MTAKTTLPDYVVSAVRKHGTAQLSIVTTAVVYLYHLTAEQRAEKQLHVAFFEASPHLSLSSWGKVLSAARAVEAREAVRAHLASAGSKADPAKLSAPLASFLSRELKAGGYCTSLDDMANWGAMRQSIAAKRIADDKVQAAAKLEEQERAKRAADEAAKAIADAKAAKDADANMPGEDPALTDTAPAVIPMPDAPVPPTPDTARAADGSLPPAIIVPPFVLLTVARGKDGLLSVEIDNAMTPDELRNVIASLQAEFDSLPVAAAVAVPA